MREIKFRAWDKEAGALVSHEILYCGNDPPANFCDFDVWTNNKQRYVPLQYTGLKDENGKEIYEGDICRLLGDKTRTAIISYSEANFMIYGLGFLTRGAVEIYKLEVIGNIYENAELLDV